MIENKYPVSQYSAINYK